MNNLEIEFVSYEQAVALKELGFDEPCLAYYENFEVTHGRLNDIGKKRYLQAPLKQQVFRWFREKYRIEPEMLSDMMGYVCSVVDRNKPLKTRLTPSNLFQTYEEAELACLEKLIELIEKK